MKKSLSNPGFESIFALSLVAILALPPLVLAQDKKDEDKLVTKRVEVSITNGDTVINGKNIKDLSGRDRDEALSYLVTPDGNRFTLFNNDGKGRIIVKRGDKGNKNIIIERRNLNGNNLHMLADGDVMVIDSLANNIDVKIKKLREQPAFAFDYQHNDDNLIPAPGTHASAFIRPFNGFGTRNSQSFTYSNVDNEGISTNISYRVSDANKEKAVKIAGTDKTLLELKNINLAPDFTSGKTTLSFSLNSKAPAEVQFKDSQGKVVWAEKANGGSFNKSFSLALNGAYYLQVKQGSNMALKRIVKED